MSWAVWGLNSLVGGTFHTHPHQICGPHSLLYNGYKVSFQGVKWLRHGADHPYPSSAKVKEEVELYLYPVPVPSRQVTG